MHLASLVPTADEHTILELLDTAPKTAPAGAIALGELRAILEWIRSLISDRRPADARDLALADEQGVMRIQPGNHRLWVGGGQPGTGAPGIAGRFETAGSLTLPR